ncbi:MAG: hypothetical protein WD852_04275 [Methyloceanibacter sp.]
MTLAVVFKGAEGIVLAADSRVTLTAQIGNEKISSHYDNATKLLKVAGQDYVAAVTYGLGALGTKTPRTAHSYLSEFEAELVGANCARLSVRDFADKLGKFFVKQHAASGTPAQAPDMVFLVGGYDVGAAYGLVFQVKIPSDPIPSEFNANDFGLTYGGQNEIAMRILNGVDKRVLGYIQKKFKLKDSDMPNIDQEIRKENQLAIPYQFLPLQDCIDLSILLVRTTTQLMQYIVGLRGVGGAVDVAAITKVDGFREIQAKKLRGQRNA